MKTHLIDGLGFTQCGLADDSVRTTSNVKNVRCKKCRKSKVYKILTNKLKHYESKRL